MTNEPEARPYQSRIDALRSAMLKRGRRAPIDALLVSDLTNIGYLSGFGGSAALLLISQTDAVFITDGRYISLVSSTCPEFTPVEAGGSGGYVEALAESLHARDTLTKIGFEDEHVTVKQMRGWRKAAPESVRWIPASGLVEKLRLVKDEGEIAAIKNAVRIAEAAFAAVQDKLTPGVSERDYALELEFTMRRMGAESPSFDTIVASGPNGAYPHHHAGERQFEAGDLVTIDWGAKASGYCSDITRTVAIPGAPVNETLRKIHAIVLEAKERSSAACTAGADGKYVDDVARDYIKEQGYGPEFKHGLGHSLGRDVHDGNTVSQRSAGHKLAPGVITTIEPGIYIDGLGGVRIEEDVLVTKDGPVVLSTPSIGLN